jgi:hypothetical protein
VVAAVAAAAVLQHQKRVEVVVAAEVEHQAPTGAVEAVVLEVRKIVVGVVVAHSSEAALVLVSRHSELVVVTER